MDSSGKIFDVQFMLETVPDILSYLPVTLYLAVLASSIGVVLGMLIALCRYLHIRVLSPLSQVFVAIMRGTPAMCQLLLAYYGIPVALSAINEQWHTSFSVNNVPAMVFGVTALGLNGAAYMSETFRSAMLGVDEGQVEACRMLNLTRWQTIRKVVLPQAVPVALAPLGNTAIGLLKDTSLVFNISIVEMMTEAKIIGSRSFRFFEVYVVVSTIYFVICFLLERLIAVAERHSRRFERSLA